MDYSKLPKLSKSDQPAASNEAPAEAQPIPYAVAPSAGVGADVWVSLIIGLLLLFMGKTFASFAIAKLSGNEFHTNVTWGEGGPKTGEVAYFELQGHTAWTDAGVFLFGLVLLFDAITLAWNVLQPGPVSRGVQWFALLLTLLGTLFNLIVCVLLFQDGILPMLSGLAVTFGGFIAMTQWQTLSNRHRNVRLV